MAPGGLVASGIERIKGGCWDPRAARNGPVSFAPVAREGSPGGAIQAPTGTWAELSGSETR